MFMAWSFLCEVPVSERQRSLAPGLSRNQCQSTLGNQELLVKSSSFGWKTESPFVLGCPWVLLFVFETESHYIAQYSYICLLSAEITGLHLLHAWLCPQVLA